jgi:hypothetical protein
MTLLIAAFLVLILAFGFVVFFGAPYLPTLNLQIHAALELANLKPGETLIELGCGDGRVLVAAAQVGVRSVGYEINPLLALFAWLRTRRFKGEVKVVWGNFWTKQWPEADAVFTFLLDKYMAKLDKKITQYNHKPVRLVSFAFQVPNREQVAEKAGVYLYEYK